MPLCEERIKLLKKFCKKNSLKLKDFELLNRAFCHTSYVFENKKTRFESYERLEFLGDAVLKLAVSDILYDVFENEMEGTLTERRGAIVSDKAIADFAKEMGFCDLILTGKCEMNQARDSILACSFEALLGAIYLDSGYKKAKNFLYGIKDKILNIEPENYKAKLQEFTQKNNHDLPKYKILKESGPQHDKTFVAGVYYKNNLLAKGKAKSRKQAEFIAAKKALDILMEDNNDG